jgi:hypothetical protein
MHEDGVADQRPRGSVLAINRDRQAKDTVAVGSATGLG